jgi:hypothetical protein
MGVAAGCLALLVTGLVDAPPVTLARRSSLPGCRSVLARWCCRCSGHPIHRLARRRSSSASVFSPRPTSYSGPPSPSHFVTVLATAVNRVAAVRRLGRPAEPAESGRLDAQPVGRFDRRANAA